MSDLFPPLTFHEDGWVPPEQHVHPTLSLERMRVWVFGSNLRGIHGAGAALIARQRFRARLGVGRGPTGFSYALPTKEHPYKSLPLKDVVANIFSFMAYATANPEPLYVVSRVGCGLAGFTDEQIAPHFAVHIYDKPSLAASFSFPEPWRSYFTTDALEAEGYLDRAEPRPEPEHDPWDFY